MTLLAYPSASFRETWTTSLLKKLPQIFWIYILRYGINIYYNKHDDNLSNPIKMNKLNLTLRQSAQ